MCMYQTQGPWAESARPFPVASTPRAFFSWNMIELTIFSLLPLSLVNTEVLCVYKKGQLSSRMLSHRLYQEDAQCQAGTYDEHSSFAFVFIVILFK